jgi:hypothetical protein
MSKELITNNYQGEKMNQNILSDQFIQGYATKTPPWGFNGMGEIVYKRTYSRDIEGLGRKEYCALVGSERDEHGWAIQRKVSISIY